MEGWGSKTNPALLRSKHCGAGELFCGLKIDVRVKYGSMLSNRREVCTLLSLGYKQFVSTCNPQFINTALQVGSAHLSYVLQPDDGIEASGKPGNLKHQSDHVRYGTLTLCCGPIRWQRFLQNLSAPLDHPEIMFVVHVAFAAL